jgi:hypothetical protein
MVNGQCFNNLVRMPLLVKVEHQSVKRLDGIGYRSVIVGKFRAVGCPHGQSVLQFIVALGYTLAHLCQPGLSA